MRKLECFIQPSRLDAIEDALWENGVTGLTVTAVRGFGSERIRPGPRLRDKFKLEIFVPDERVDEIVELVQKVARTGEMGDGKIMVLPADNVIRIRTGEKGAPAL